MTIRLFSVVLVLASLSACDVSAPPLQSDARLSGDLASRPPVSSTVVPLPQGTGAHLVYAFSGSAWDGSFTSESLDSDGNVVVRFQQRREVRTPSTAQELVGDETYVLYASTPHPDVTVREVRYLRVTPDGEEGLRSLSAQSLSMDATPILIGGAGARSEHHHGHGEDRVDTEEGEIEACDADDCRVDPHVFRDAKGQPVSGINNVALVYEEGDLPKVVAIRFSYPAGTTFKYRFGDAWESIF